MTDIQKKFNYLVSIRRYLLWIPVDMEAHKLIEKITAEEIEAYGGGLCEVLEEAHDRSEKWSGIAKLLDAKDDRIRDLEYAAYQMELKLYGPAVAETSQ